MYNVINFLHFSIIEEILYGERHHNIDYSIAVKIDTFILLMIQEAIEETVRIFVLLNYISQ